MSAARNIFANCVNNEPDCLPDACGNDEREAALMQRQRRDDDRNFFHRILSRDRNLIIACAVLVILMNINTGRYLLYPFKIFSTWVHEMCHGVAAILMGGRIAKLTIKSDGGGYAITAVPGASWKRGFVASGGYPGTAILGGLLLLYRRTTLGPTIGTIGLGVCQLLSVALYVRDKFGILMLSGEGIFLLFAAWLLPAVWLDNLFNFLALTISLNALTTIQDIFAISQAAEDGEEVNTDAHSVAEKWGLDYRFWAILWLIMSFVATFLGIVFARDARELSWHSGGSSKPTTTTAPTSSGTVVNNGYSTAASPPTSPANATTSTTATAATPNTWTTVPYVAYTV